MSAVSQLLGDLLKEIARDREIEITVFCSRVTQNKRLRNFHDVAVKPVTTFNLGKKNFLTQFLDYSLFYLYIFFSFLFSWKWDAIVSLTTPPFTGFVLAIATLFKRVPLLYYVQDLFPEILYDMGYIRKPWLIRKLQILNRITLRNAKTVIVIGEHMAEKITNNYRGIEKKIHVVSNWAVGIDYKECQNGDEFVMLYSGNMGVGHDFTKLAEILEKLRVIEKIQYRFIGGGRREREIRNVFRLQGESRVRFQGYLDRNSHNKILKYADIFLIAQKRETIGDILPSKLYSYLAAGRPMLFLGPRNSEIGKTIINNDIGIVVENSADTEQAQRYVRFLKDSPASAREIGKRARRLFENKHQLCFSVTAFRSLLEDCVTHYHGDKRKCSEKIRA